MYVKMIIRVLNDVSRPLPFHVCGKGLANDIIQQTLNRVRQPCGNLVNAICIVCDRHVPCATVFTFLLVVRFVLATTFFRSNSRVMPLLHQRSHSFKGDATFSNDDCGEGVSVYNKGKLKCVEPIFCLCNRAVPLKVYRCCTHERVSLSTLSNTIVSRGSIALHASHVLTV